MADHPAYDRILERLQEIDGGLYFEFSTSGEPVELIITAEGNARLFPLVEAIVAAAPPVPGWAIIALKPKLGFPAMARWESVTVPIADVFFLPLQGRDPGDLGLRLFFRGLDPGDAGATRSSAPSTTDSARGSSPSPSGAPRSGRCRRGPGWKTSSPSSSWRATWTGGRRGAGGPEAERPPPSRWTGPPGRGENASMRQRAPDPACSPSVHLVLDRDFRGDLPSLARSAPVWIIGLMITSGGTRP